VDYSVVVPVYNGQRSLEELCSRIFRTFESLGHSFEIILVNDASPDGSWHVIRQLKPQYGNHIKGVDLASNVGQHKALLCGFQFVEGQFAITIDDDLQIPPEEIGSLLERQKRTGAEVVYGVYANKKHGAVRNLGSKLMEKMFHRFASTPGKGSSFKLLGSRIVGRLESHNHSYVYLDELIGWYAHHVEFVSVKHESRKQGKSGYNVLKLFFMVLNLTINYTIVPLRMITWFGLISAVVFFFIGLYFIYMKYTVGAYLGFTALIVAIFFSTGLILFCLGIIGEYISRIFAMQSRKPQFRIKEVLE